jgi:hypothetical protein
VLVIWGEQQEGQFGWTESKSSKMGLGGCRWRFTLRFSYAIPANLQVGFPEWKLPLSGPVSRTILNPFTREEMTFLTRDPEWDELVSDEMETPQWAAVNIEGDYETYLQQRLPPFVQSKPHWCSKGLTEVEIGPLVAAFIGIEEVELEIPIYAHPSCGIAIVQLPRIFLAHLSDSDEATLKSMALKWANTMSSPEYTHSVSGDRLYEDWTLEDGLRVVKPLADLLSQGRESQLMYLLIEA